MANQRILLILAGTMADASAFAASHKLRPGQWCFLHDVKQVKGQDRPLYVVAPRSFKNPQFRELMLELRARDAQYASLVDDGGPAPLGENDLGAGDNLSDRLA